MMRVGMRWRALASIGFAAVVIAACYAPTEVRLQITTDRNCGAQKAADDVSPRVPAKNIRTLIEVGPSVSELTEQADTEGCTTPAPGNGDIGSLVLVPRGDRNARATVQVTMTVDGSDPHLCALGGAVAPQCIVTRRTFSFLEHEARSLPIRLYSACRGVFCRSDQGCDEQGLCKFADIDLPCQGDACDAGVPRDASDAAESDATVVKDTGAPDARADADADAGNTLCAAPNGTNELVVGSAADATDKLTGNSKRLFWVSGGGVASISKRGAPALALPFNASWVNAGGITAIAADDKTLWVATPSSVQPIDLMSNTLGAPLTVVETTSIGFQRGAPGEAPVPYFLTTSELHYLSNGSLATVLNSTGGERLVVGSSVAFGFSDIKHLITRYGLTGVSTPTTFPINFPVRGADSLVDALFYAIDDPGTGRPIHRVAMGTDSTLYSVGAPGPVAVDDTLVYYVDQGMGAATNPARLRRGFQSAAIGAAPPADVASNFYRIESLVIDGNAVTGCAYFWAIKSAGAASSRKLYVYPKTPTQ